MNRLNYIGSLIFLSIFCFFGSLFSNDMNELLEQIEKRAKELENERPYTVHIKSIISEMNGDWEPKKVTTTNKIVTKSDSVEYVEIKSSIIEEKGDIKDNTKNAKKEAAENKGGGMKMSGEGFLPFSSDNRNLYNFKVIADTTLNGQTAMVLKATAKEKNDKLYNGKYYINSKDFTLLGFESKPSKNPKMIKDIHIKMNFGINESNVYTVKRFELKTHAKVLVKNFRFHIIETYEKYEYLD